MTILFGAIADDITGASDLALTLANRGLRTVQIIGVPDDESVLPEADALVIALKSRTTPAEQAVAESLEALRWLQNAGCRQLFFKYCSTFDSTKEGNIGPVTEALMEALETDQTIACPAFPANGRTVYQGHLFVYEQLLSESPLKDHPLTPMNDANLVRVLQAQSRRKVGLLNVADIEAGSTVIRQRLETLAESGFAMVITDALNIAHLLKIGTAVADFPLVTGGSAIAMGLVDNFKHQGLVAEQTTGLRFWPTNGAGAILAGSCSAATRSQVKHALQHCAGYQLDPISLATDNTAISKLLAWITNQGTDQPVLIYSTNDPESIASAQKALGRDKAAQIVEQALSRAAQALVEKGVQRLVIAGGETSGAVTQALGMRTLEIGAEIEPGVPWCRSLDHDQLAITLKSGNFGGIDFFLRALEDNA